jgi:replicative DNA helicase
MAVNIKKDFSGLRQQQRRPDLASLVYGKIPPQAIELEEAVLGAMMLEPHKQVEVFGIIPSEDCLYVDAHQKIFAAMKALFGAGKVIDLLTVTEQLRKQNELEIVGGAYFLTRLTMSVISSAHVEAHARIVMEKYMLRELIRVSGETISQAYEDSTDVFELMDSTEAGLFGISNMAIRKAYMGAPELARAAEAAYLRRQQYQADVSGVTTGYRGLDKITNGWNPGKLIIIAARPSVGKTAFAINLALNGAAHIERNKSQIASWEKGTGIGFFSLEMGADELTNRFIAALGYLPLDGIAKGNLPEYQQHEFYNAKSLFAQLNIHIDDTPGLNLFELRTKARRMVEQEGVGLIVIDYLQLMEAILGKSGNREQEISAISRGLKGLGKELKVPIIALSQLSRKVEERGGKPQLGDLRESGAIEQDADIVIFLSRPDYQKKSHEVDPAMQDEAEIDIAKTRDGASDTIRMYFLKGMQVWMSMPQYDAWKGIPGLDAPSVPRGIDNPRAGIPTGAGESKLFIQGEAGDTPF